MITEIELHERKFVEINNELSNEHTDKNPLVFANYVKACMLIQNGGGYIPYIHISLASKLGQGDPCTMITTIDELDNLLSQL